MKKPVTVNARKLTVLLGENESKRIMKYIVRSTGCNPVEFIYYNKQRMGSYSLDCVIKHIDWAVENAWQKNRFKEVWLETKRILLELKLKLEEMDDNY